MGMIINVDEALKNRSTFNLLGEPLHAMLLNQQEAFEKQNPIDLLYVRNSISTFQETYTSSIGFEHAFAETGDYSIGPIFNTAEGFAATYTTRTFQGGFVITQQAIEDRRIGKIKDDASSFQKAWHRDEVEYAVTAISGGFAGAPVYWGSDKNGGRSKLRLNSADTVDGELDSAKNPLFSNAHTVVKRETMSATDIDNAKQSNLFYANIDLTGNDAGKIAKLADVINQVITTMENYKDDNNKRAGVTGAKTIVTSNNAAIKGAINTALSMETFKQGETMYINQAYNAATADYTPYLLDIPQCAKTSNGCAQGFFIIDKEYNASNHGPEFTERVPFTLDVTESNRPKGVNYDGRQRFDINCASWRGIAYVYLGTPAGSSDDWDEAAKFTEIVPSDTIVKPVTVVGTVTTAAGA